MEEEILLSQVLRFLHEKYPDGYVPEFKINSIKSFVIPLNYAKACNEFTDPSPRHCARAKQLLSKQGWRAVGNTVLDLTGPTFEPQTFRFRDERVTARPTGRLFVKLSIRTVQVTGRNVMAKWPDNAFFFNILKRRLCSLIYHAQRS